jgi:pyruvate ferredoxin oxidoreductase delta subunit
MSNGTPKGWKDLPPGGLILEPGTSAAYQTGSWRTFRPVWKEENCIHCLFCFIYCPDSAVQVENDKFKGFDYRYCKGCGICAHECPGKAKVKAITMVEESTFEE